MASLVRQYTLFYHLQDGMIEMYDPKNRRTFLKKCNYDKISLKHLYVGSKISVYSRQLTIVSYGDIFTEKSLRKANAKGLCIVKAPAYHLAGSLLAALLNDGFQLTNAKLCKLTLEQASKIVSTKHQSGEAKSLAEGPVFAFGFRRNDSVAILNEICGFSGKPMDSKIRKILSKLPGDAALHVSMDPNTVQDSLDYIFGKSIYSSASLKDCTLCCIKPQAVNDGYTGQIIEAILGQGYQISGCEMFRLDYEAAREFLEVYDTVVPHFGPMVKHMAEGPVVALEIRSKDGQSVKNFRQFAGPADPVVARHIRPYTLRAKFGKDRVANGIHCTDLPEDGVLESEFFFSILQKAK
eukprot:1056807-Amorphochlora_amoeboformis.AAC.1